MPPSGRAPGTATRRRRVQRFGALAAATCGVLSGSLVAAGGAQAASATATSAGLAPASITVTVAPVRETTAVTLRASRTTVVKGHSSQLTGVVTVGPARRRLAGATVKLLARSPGGKWRTVLTRKLTADGVFKAYPKPGRTRYYKLVVAASATRTAAVSKPVTITVRPTARQKIVAAAVSRIGKPYVYGASGPNAFDCSGLTAYAYRKAGVALPHSANGQKRYGRAVSKSAAKPGDLVVFYSGGYAYHAAIYAGNGYIYEAARPGTRVGRHRIWSSAIGFRRVVG
ncbi:C40 family peptidase [Luedemannella flava]